MIQPDIREQLNKRFGFVYPYEYRREIPVKVSVSELKKKSYHEEFLIPKIFAESEELKSKELIVETDLVITPIIPRFIEKKTEAEEEITGAARGTAYHV